MKHVLVNVPEVDCSYKHASGGILSSVEDLLKFANAMLQRYFSFLWVIYIYQCMLFYSYQSNECTNFLKSETVHELWDKTFEGSHGYTLGWVQWPVDCIDKSSEKHKNQIWLIF